MEVNKIGNVVSSSALKDLLIKPYTLFAFLIAAEVYMKGGGGGVTTYIFLIWMYPVKTKGEPKAGAGFLTNCQPKSGANHICYNNATQSRGKLVSVQIDILFGEKPAEKMDRGQHMSQRRGDFFILNENPTQCRGLADFVNPLPGGGGGKS